MRDIRTGEAVFICRPDSHPHPVYLYGQRSMEVGAEPMSIRWNGYYHSLRAEGAIQVLDAADVAAAAAERDKQLAEADAEELNELCANITKAAEADADALASRGAGQLAANARAAAAERVTALRARWEALHPPKAE